MLPSSRLLGMIVFAAAISLCLTFCAVPYMLAQNAPVSDCHSENEKDPSDQDHFCCKTTAILSVETCFYSAPAEEELIQDLTISPNPSSLVAVFPSAITASAPISTSNRVLRI